MDICILTSYTDEIWWNNYGKCDYGDLSSKNHLNYANTHNYTYIKRIVKDSDYSNWNPTWIKIDVLLKILPLFDYVVWIDCDAIFIDEKIKIEEFITDGVDLVIPKLEMDRTTGKMHTNTTTGFMIWKNSKWSMDILTNMWNDPGDCRFDYFHEQSKLNKLLQNNFSMSGGENIDNKEIEDLEAPIILNNIKIIPYAYHRYYNDGELKYVYHAGGDTPTKTKRIQEMLLKK
jgi:hypothetical protein